MGGFYCKILSHITTTNGDAPLYLAADGDNVVVKLYDSADLDQKWSVEYVDTDGNFKLRNEGVRMYMYVPDTPTNNYYCKLSSTQLGNAVWNKTQCGAIRLTDDSNKNLNVLGDIYKDGTQVGVWKWCGSNSNELWDIISF